MKATVKRGLGAALFLVCGICVAEARNMQQVMPSYAETAFPEEMRAIATTNLTVEAMRCRSRSCHVDGRIVREIGKAVDGELVRMRVARRQEVRDRAQMFAEANLRRGGAAGLGFAEQSLADVEEINRLLEDELRFWKTVPRTSVRPVVLNLRDFGATGDGVTDDAMAFARANAALRQLGGAPSILRIPAGTYRIVTTRTTKPFTTASGEYNLKSAGLATMVEAA